MIFGDDRTHINKISKKQEMRAAKTYKGSRNAGSGSGWLRKNDVRAESLLIENKLTTGSKSITLKSLDLRELETRAILEDRLPVLQFDLNGKSYVVLLENDFIEMINYE
jgi:hypothetical protein